MRLWHLYVAIAAALLGVLSIAYGLAVRDRPLLCVGCEAATDAATAREKALTNGSNRP